MCKKPVGLTWLSVKSDSPNRFLRYTDPKKNSPLTFELKEHQTYIAMWLNKPPLFSLLQVSFLQVSYAIYLGNDLACRDQTYIAMWLDRPPLF